MNHKFCQSICRVRDVKSLRTANDRASSHRTKPIAPASSAWTCPLRSRIWIAWQFWRHSFSRTPKLGWICRCSHRLHHRRNCLPFPIAQLATRSHDFPTAAKILRNRSFNATCLLVYARWSEWAGACIHADWIDRRRVDRLWYIYQRLATT